MKITCHKYNEIKTTDVFNNLIVLIVNEHFNTIHTIYIYQVLDFIPQNSINASIIKYNLNKDKQIKHQKKPNKTHLNCDTSLM